MRKTNSIRRGKKKEKKEKKQLTSKTQKKDNYSKEVTGGASKNKGSQNIDLFHVSL